MDKDPFGYSALTYAWVIGLATVASVIRNLNNMSRFSLARLLIDALSGGFTGLLTFWLCESSNITGPLSAFLIGVSGLMGSRAWQEFANMLRAKLGIPRDDGGPDPALPSPIPTLSPLPQPTPPQQPQDQGGTK